MPIYKGIRVRTHYDKMPHPAYAGFVALVYRSVVGNPHFPNPPIDLDVLKAVLGRYTALIAAAEDRSKTVLAQRNSVRSELDKLVRQLAHYVENVSNDDSAIFATSGFESLPNARVPAEPLAPAKILKLAHGSNSGVVLVTLTPSLRKVKYYEVRYAIQESEATPDAWETELFTSANGPVSISNLTPGKRYAFQVRALGSLGFTDWSDSTTLICT
jgi:hypothetical protein